MEYTEIPNLQKSVSRIGLGTWAIGGALWGGTDEAISIKTILSALEKGINLIDTAPAYGNGESEKIVGKAIKSYGKRDQVIIATKVGLNQEIEGKVFRDSRKASIRKELDDSLKRLQVDYIDLYQIHWPDPTTPIQEAAETMKALLNAGKIRAIGVSNYTVDQIREFRKYAPLNTVQPPFNLFEREQESTVIQYSLANAIAVLSYSSLCRGLLTGKMTLSREFKDDDLRKGMDPKFKQPLFTEYVQAADALSQWVEKKYKRPLIALAVRWVLDKGINVSLWGARRPDQLNDIIQIFGWHLSQEDFAEIDAIIDRYVKHPVGPEFMSPPIRENAS